MNSPAHALVWEIGRKHRWSWLLLAVLLALCAAGTLRVQELDRRARDLENTKRIEGSLTPYQLLPFSPTGRVAQVIRFTLNSKVIYEGLITRRDEVSWSGDETRLQVTLNELHLFDGPTDPRGDRLSWSPALAGGGKVLLVPGDNQGSAMEARALANEWLQFARIWGLVLMGFSVLLLFVIFGDTEPQAGRGFTGLPPRRFALPVRTFTLVAWPVLLGSVAVVALTMAWCRLVLSGLLPQGVSLPELYLTLELLAALTLFQAIVWGLPSFPKTRVALLTLLIFVLVVFTSYRFGNPHESLAEVQWGFAAAWLVGGVAAYGGVQLERQGQWTAWQRRSRFATLVHRLSPRPIPLKSALGTQIWFEWKRNCRLSLVLWTLLVWVILAGNWLQTTAPPAIETGVIQAFLGFCVFVSLTGLNLGRDITAKELSLSSFTATRPIDSGTLVISKLIAGLATWLAACLIGVASVLVGIALTGVRNNPTYPWPSAWGESLFWLTGLVISLQLFVGILPLCLSGRIRGIPWSLLPLLLVIGGVFNGIVWLGHRQWPQDLVCSLLGALVALKLVMAFWGFRRSIVTRLTSPAFVMVYVVIWLLATGLCLSIVVACNPTQDGQVAVAWTLTAVLAVPLARIAISPLSLALNRHR